MPDPKLVSWTRAISSHIRSGQADLSLREFRLMCESGLRPNDYVLSLVLKAGRLAGQPTIGKLLHCQSIKSGLEANPFCSTSILAIYSKYDQMNDARLLFDGITIKSQALWNSFIDGYSRRRSDAQQPVVALFHQMLLSSASPNCFTYTILIKFAAAKTDIGFVRFLHGRVVKIGFQTDCFVCCALIDAYAKLLDLNDACNLFSGMEERDHVVWCALLAGLQQGGEAEKALDLYLGFVSEGYKMDSFMFATLFNLCSDLGVVGFGLQLHSCLLKSGFQIDCFIGSALIDMYVSFGMTHYAYGSFLGATEKNGVVYSAMIHGFVVDSNFFDALDMVIVMGKLGMVFYHSTVVSMLRVFASLDLLEEGRAVHCRVVKTMPAQDLIIGNSLIDMYSKFRAIDDAVKVFMGIEVPNEFSWTSLMQGYVESERHDEAFELYHMMLSSCSTRPNEYTIVASLQACSGLLETCHGKQIHGFIIKMGFHLHAFVDSSLIGMYAKHGCMDDASQIFLNLLVKDTVSLTTMIAFYAQNGHGEKALNTFLQYKEGSSNIDESVLSSCFSACSSLISIEMGRCLHQICVKIGYDSNLQVGGAIIDMYCKCGSIKDASQFFNEMREHNVISYTTMISGYSQHGLVPNALRLFEEMIESGVIPDGVTFVEILSACSHSGLVKEGWEYFESITKFGLQKTMNHYACMVDLLGRAGFVEKAKDLIKNAPFVLKTSLWRTLLGACSKHGDVNNGGRIAEIICRSEPNNTSNYVMLSNLFASDSMWDCSHEVKSKMKQEFMKKTPGYSWIA